MRVALYGVKVAEWLQEVQAMFPNDPISTNNITFVHPHDPHSHAIVFNNAIPSRSPHVGPSRVLGFALEPHEFLRMSPEHIALFNQRIRKYIMGEPLPGLRVGQAGFSLVPSAMHLSVPSSPLSFNDRPYFVSFPLSDKKTAAGHKYRHELANAILADPRHLPVHFWGRGTYQLPQKDDRVKGGFIAVEPYTQYRYTIAIENNQQGKYFTEKITLPIYCGCVPLYLGSPAIDEFFPGGCLRLTGNVRDDVELVAQLCSNKQDTAEVDLQNAKEYFQRKWHWGRYIESLFAA